MLHHRWTYKQTCAQYVSSQEFDGHAQDEPRPEGVQSQQHKQQAVEEAEPEEGLDDGQRVHERRMYDPGRGRTKEPTQNHLQSPSTTHQEIRSAANHYYLPET